MGDKIAETLPELKSVWWNYMITNLFGKVMFCPECITVSEVSNVTLLLNGQFKSHFTRGAYALIHNIVKQEEEWI